MNKQEYYQLMENMNEKDKFPVLLEKWKKCFHFVLLSFNVGFTEQSINSLFEDWDMENWKEMWLENSEYKDYSKDRLIATFCNECGYISDRVSYDRLFRTHWLFKKAFYDELKQIK